MPPEQPNSYDLIPYHFGAHYDTHPDRLATLATLFGLKPAPVEGCRVLELGCAGGGNLIPMAHALPGSRFLGLDLSRTQVAAGCGRIEQLGLKNIHLLCRDVLDYDGEEGNYDYIIAHGLYSWVPQAVQQKIFRICQRCLSPHGVAYISYNILPGWSLKQQLRQSTLFQLRDIHDPHERYRRALEWLEFLSRETRPMEDPAYSAYLAGVVATLRERATVGRGIHYWYHEFLDDCNQPVYFYEMAAEAERHGLAYLADSDLALMFPTEFPAETAARISENSAGLVDLEQNLDFLRNRSFRQSLFVRSEIARVQRPGAAQLANLQLRCRLKPAPAEENAPLEPGEAAFSTSQVTLKTNIPLNQAVFYHLAQSFPNPMKFDDLVSAASRELDPSTAGRSSVEELAVILFNLAASLGRILEFSTWQPPRLPAGGVRPLASSVARLMAANGASVTNLRHESLTMDDTSRFTLWCLDGSREPADILVMYREAWKAGRLQFPGCQSVEDFDRHSEPILEEIGKRIARFASLDLLTG